MRDLNSTYYLHQETSKTGVMKRSGMDVGIISKLITQPVFNVSFPTEL
jgi:hypothetical protein